MLCKMRNMIIKLMYLRFKDNMLLDMLIYMEKDWLVVSCNSRKHDFSKYLIYYSSTKISIQ